MSLHLNSTARGMILVLVPVAIELVFLSAVGTRLYDATKEYEKLQRSRDALIQLHHFEQVAEDALLALAKNDDTDADKKIHDIDKLIAALETPWANANSSEHPELNALMRDSEETRLNLIEVLKTVRARLWRQLGRLVTPVKLPPKTSTISMFMEVRPLSKKIIEIETDMLKSDAGQIESLTWKLGILLAGGAIIGFLVSVSLVRDFTSVFLSRLSAVADKAFLLAGGKELPPPIEGNDELAELDRVLWQAHKELRNARQKQFAILDNARDVLCTLDARLRFTTTGDAASKVWLYQPDDLLGLSVISIVSEPTQALTRAHLEMLSERGGECEFENDVKRKDGSTRPFLWKVTYSKEKESYFCVAHDVSELKAAQQLKQQFLATASEEIRNPLDLANSLLSSLTDERSAELPRGAQEELEKASYNLNRLTELVAELLDLEALASIDRDLERAPISAAAICHQAAQSLEALAQARSVTILPAQNDATILADQKRLLQALINLLSNAIKFSPPDSTVTLAVDTQANQVTISVIDDGPGIPEPDRKNLFGKFQKTRNTDKSKIKGSGLGLAIVKSIAEAHGGNAGFKPSATGGSCFYIALPAWTGGQA